MKLKSLFVFLLSLVCFFGLQAQKRVSYSKKSSISLTAAQAKTLKKNPMFKVTGLNAYPASGFIIYAYKNNHFLALQSELKKAFKKIPSNISAQFQDIGSGTASDGTILIWVCSCGDNKYDSEGDMCYMRMRASGVPECTGGCHGDNEGKNCSVTMDVIYPNGSIGTTQQN